MGYGLMSQELKTPKGCVSNMLYIYMMYIISYGLVLYIIYMEL